MAAPDRGAEAREQVGTELRRVVRRWQQLPLDHALSRAPMVRELVQSLADRVAAESGLEQAPVPDLGPAVLVDQLRVMVFDYERAGLPMSELAAAMTSLRRALG